MAHVKVARGVGEHVQGIEARPTVGRILGSFEDALVLCRRDRGEEHHEAREEREDEDELDRARHLVGDALELRHDRREVDHAHVGEALDEAAHHIFSSGRQVEARDPARGIGREHLPSFPCRRGPLRVGCVPFPSRLLRGLDV